MDFLKDTSLQQCCNDVMYFLSLQITYLICVDCDIGSKEKTKIRNDVDSKSCNPDPESSIPLLQENKYKVKQLKFIVWSVYCTYSVSKHKTVDGLPALERSHYYSRIID